MIDEGPGSVLPWIEARRSQVNLALAGRVWMRDT